MVDMFVWCSVLTATGSTVSATGNQLNTLSAGGSPGVPEGQIEVVTAHIIADTTQPDEECVMDVQVWVKVSLCACVVRVCECVCATVCVRVCVCTLRVCAALLCVCVCASLSVSCVWSSHVLCSGVRVRACVRHF
jgi:hypothetical protein